MNRPSRLTASAALLAWALLGAACATAPEPLEADMGTIYEAMAVEVPPIIRAAYLPEYPASLRESGKIGEVIVEFVVDRRGNVQELTALRATAPEFAASALAALARWKFAPGRLAGEAVAVRVQLPLQFDPKKLSTPRDQAIGSSSGNQPDSVRPAVPAHPLPSPDSLETFAKPETTFLPNPEDVLATRLPGSAKAWDPKSLPDQRPVAVVRIAPRYPHEMHQRNLAGSVTVEFLVTVKGEVKMAKVVSATSPEFGREALLAIEQWKFEPGRKDGRPVPVRMQMPITFDLEDPPQKAP